jgi:2-phosphosulfolactate phosphatase
MANFSPSRIGATAAKQVAEHHSRVAIIGAGSRGTFREEDQICCAWIADHLMEMGFAAGNSETLALVKRWPVGSIEGIMSSASSDYLLRSGQGRDLEFVLSHVADLDKAYALDGDEIIEAGTRESEFAPT